MASLRYLSDSEIQAYADTFLSDHEYIEPPVDIEYIIESRMDIRVIPLDGLRVLLDVEGLISISGERIFVDSLTYRTFYRRTRFTLAHEIGHLVLHGELFERNRISTLQQYARIHESLDDVTVTRAEIQAGIFAGMVLVPRMPLANHVEQRMNFLREASSTGLKGGMNYTELIALLSTQIAPHFEVSAEVVRRRIQAEGLLDGYRHLG